MTVTKTERPRYVVSVHEVEDVPGVLKFKFVLRGPQGQRAASEAQRAPQYVVRAGGNPDNPTFDWNDSPQRPGGGSG